MIYFIVFFAIIVLDQLSKAFTEAHATNISLFGGWLQITNGTRNSGMAFSLLSNEKWAQVFFLVATLAILTAFSIYLIVTKNENPFLKTSIIFIMGGAVGNAIDRVVYKAVRDFIYVRYYSTFNIADSFICVGAVMLAIYFLFMSPDALFKKKKDEKKL